jgi:hypothetical protein
MGWAIALLARIGPKKLPRRVARGVLQGWRVDFVFNGVLTRCSATKMAQKHRHENNSHDCLHAATAQTLLPSATGNIFVSDCNGIRW